MDTLVAGQVIVAGLTALGGGSTIYSLIRLGTERKNLQAQAESARVEAASKLVRSSLDLLEPVESRARSLEQSLDHYKRRVGELEQLVNGLREALEALNVSLAEERDKSRRELGRLSAQLAQSEQELKALRALNLMRKRGDFDQASGQEPQP